MSRIRSVRKIGRMTTGKMMIAVLTSMSMAMPILTSLQATILLRVNAAFGILIAQPVTNLLQETAFMFLPVHG